MDAILALAADGSFESFEGVLPGEYSMQVSINGRNFEQQTITVPKGTPGTIDLGNIMVNMNTPVTGRIKRKVQTPSR
jgi:outer membrane usher protein FimD/PapC